MLLHFDCLGSDRDSFDDRCTGAGVDLPRKAEAGTGEQLLVFSPRPLFPPDYQDPDVQRLCPGMLGVGLGFWFLAGQKPKTKSDPKALAHARTGRPGIRT